MLQVNFAKVVTAIDSNDPRQQFVYEDVTEELRTISGRLKEALASLGDWVSASALSFEASQKDFTEASSRELNITGAQFTSAYSQLAMYLQQFPGPADYGIACGMDKILDTLLRQDLPKETFCETAVGPRSWGDMIHPTYETDWTGPLLEQFLQNIPQASWRRARDLILAAGNHLP